MTKYSKYEDLMPLPLNIPQSFQAGFAYALRPDLEWVLDYKFIDWSGVEQIGNAPIRGGFGWRDQHVIKTGLTWDVNPKWTLRAGFPHGKSPIREDVVFANGLFPAIVESHATFGGVLHPFRYFRHPFCLRARLRQDDDGQWQRRPFFLRRERD